MFMFKWGQKQGVRAARGGWQYIHSHVAVVVEVVMKEKAKLRCDMSSTELGLSGNFCKCVLRATIILPCFMGALIIYILH